MLAGTIGSRPIGSQANRRAREYLLDQLTRYGFDVRVQEADGVRRELGRTAHVANIIAIKQGARPDALALVAHYDSVPDSPGAGDDALGVAVCLEAGRLLAARAQPNYTLMILLTDGEESGLMGAAALVADPDIANRVRAFLNVESIGSGGPVMLFETGPANGWLVRQWADAAAGPRGSSYATEIYRRLPNDTDFTILKRLGVPGLNFASIGESDTYHTARDTPDRLSTSALRQAGDQVLSVAAALDRVDLSERTAGEPVYFDIAGRFGVSYTRGVAYALGLAALLFGALAWMKLLGKVRTTVGVGRLVVTALWAILGTGVVAGTLWLTTWAVRATREVYHPWYAHPDRFFLLLGLMGLGAIWGLLRFAAVLPAMLRGSGDQAAIWTLTLPIWLLAAAILERVAPAASYLWTLPLLVAGVCLSAAPVGGRAAVTASSFVVAVVTTLLWARDAFELLHFVVAQMGRLPIITPLFVYPALLLTAGMMIVPPAIALVAGFRGPALRPSVTTAFLLTLIVVAVGLTYAAPAYTASHPLRRHVRLLQDAASGRVVWEVGGTEPGLDLEADAGARLNWFPAGRRTEAGSVIGRMRQPFVFEAAGTPVSVPATIGVVLSPQGATVDLEITVTAPESSTVSFVLPAGMTPVEPSLAGRSRDGRWIADYVAPAADGVTFRARITSADVDRLGDASVVIQTAHLPGGSGWQGLPRWLPREHVVWDRRAAFVESLSPHVAAAAGSAAGQGRSVLR